MPPAEAVVPRERTVRTGESLAGLPSADPGDMKIVRWPGLLFVPGKEGAMFVAEEEMQDAVACASWFVVATKAQRPRAETRTPRRSDPRENDLLPSLEEVVEFSGARRPFATIDGSTIRAAEGFLHEARDRGVFVGSPLGFVAPLSNAHWGRRRGRPRERAVLDEHVTSVVDSLHRPLGDSVPRVLVRVPLRR